MGAVGTAYVEAEATDVDDDNGDGCCGSSDALKGTGFLSCFCARAEEIQRGEEDYYFREF